MKEAKFLRDGSLIIDLSLPQSDPQRTKQCGSVNKAKKESAKIQLREDGALGRGSVQTI